MPALTLSKIPSKLLQMASYEALRLLILSLAPTHCPTCGCDLHLSPTTNLPPRFKEAITPTDRFCVALKAELFDRGCISEVLAPAVEQLAAQIVDSGKTMCAELPVVGDGYRTTDKESNLSLLIRAENGLVRIDVGMA